MDLSTRKPFNNDDKNFTAIVIIKIKFVPYKYIHCLFYIITRELFSAKHESSQSKGITHQLNHSFPNLISPQRTGRVMLLRMIWTTTFASTISTSTVRVWWWHCRTHISSCTAVRTATKILLRRTKGSVAAVSLLWLWMV